MSGLHAWARVNMSWQQRSLATRQALVLHADLFESSSDDELQPSGHHTDSTTSSSSDDESTRNGPPRANVGLDAVDRDGVPAQSTQPGPELELQLEPQPQPEPEPQPKLQMELDPEPQLGPQLEPESQLLDFPQALGVGRNTYLHEVGRHFAPSISFQAETSLDVATAADLRRRRAARTARSRRRAEDIERSRHQKQLAGKSSCPKFRTMSDKGALSPRVAASEVDSAAFFLQMQTVRCCLRGSTRARS